jgi:hypothetical protein
LNLIEQSLNETIRKYIDEKYQYINIKLAKLKRTQLKTPNTNVEFFSRVINSTNIDFSEEELSILKQGLKYNASYKPQNWIQTLALEAGTAVNFLPILEQDHIRWQIEKNINKLHKCNLKQTHSHNATERRIIRSIKEKLETNKARITRADKGNIIVITYLQDYNKKSMILYLQTNFTH